MNSTVLLECIHMDFVLGIFVIPSTFLSSTFENAVTFRFAYSSVSFYSSIKIILCQLLDIHTTSCIYRFQNTK